MTLPYRLKELRQQKNLTQAKVADSLGITQQSYARWENGKVTPTPEILRSNYGLSNRGTKRRH